MSTKKTHTIEKKRRDDYKKWNYLETKQNTIDEKETIIKTKNK